MTGLSARAAPSRIRLLIIDQSLRDFTGHHFEYSTSVAKAAIRCGVSATIAAHREWPAGASPDGLRIMPVFESSWNAAHRSALEERARFLLAALPHELRTSAIAAAAATRRALKAFVGARQSRPMPLPGFGREVAGLIAREGLGADDHVLIHTLSVPEFHALIPAVAALATLPHLHVVLRRDATEPPVRPDAAGRIRPALAAVAAQPRLAGAMRLWSDTEHLCRQYEALAGRSVGLLPIPHDLPADAVAGERTSTGPVVATYLGDARTEKGFQALPAAVGALRSSHLDTGRLRFVLQANSSMSLEDAVIERARRALAAYPRQQVELLHDALDATAFVERLVQADLVLLPYAAEAYRRRSSGILVQALACGKPVVVPAGSWLAAVAPPGTAVTFSGPGQIAQSIATAVEQYHELADVARRSAPAWRLQHSSEALLTTLLAGN
jgi:glycosyltransferase involved in cell wall biosynthesis